MIQTSPKEFIHCEICGVLQEKTTGNRKYCDKCRAEANRQRRLKSYRINKAKKTAKVPTKSASQVDAEARSYGMSYGEYSVALQYGTLPERKTTT